MSPDEQPDQEVQDWVRQRLPSGVAHLDVAASGRVSQAVLEAETAHLRAEASGAYVAEAAAEQGVLAQGRAALGALVGLGGDDVAFTSDGGSAFAVLMAGWRGGRGARVGTVASEYGANARVLARLAAARGWDLVELPADALGRVRDVPDGLDLLALPQVASQRGVAQPVAQLLATGVPVVLDVAQSLGQTAVPAGCAAYVATSRKWLCGPRGVGALVVEPGFAADLEDPPTLAPTLHAGVRRFELQEPHVAGRVGLAVALQEWTPGLLPVVHALAASARRALGVAGWEVVEPQEEPTGITTLVPPPGVEPLAVRAALLEHGVLVSAVPATRAAELSGPVLRVSTAAWVRPEEVERLAELISTVCR